MNLATDDLERPGAARHRHVDAVPGTAQKNHSAAAPGQSSKKLIRHGRSDHFICGQLHSIPADFLEPGNQPARPHRAWNLFFGAFFVLYSSFVNLQTTIDLLRMGDLEQETFADPLTGVYNRRFMQQLPTEEISQARRYGFPLSVLMFDLDFFKRKR
jgi:GGDEF domain-containing protein